MSKRQDKISKIEAQLAELEKQRKQEVKKAREEERKATNKRHCKRGTVMEKALPDLITITDEQFNTFVEKTLATNHSRNALAELMKQNEATPPTENKEQAQPKPQPKEQANSQTVSGANHSKN